MGLYFINNPVYPITSVTGRGVTRFFQRSQAEQELKALQRELFKRPNDMTIKLKMMELRKYLKDTDPKKKKAKLRK